MVESARNELTSAPADAAVSHCRDPEISARIKIRRYFRGSVSAPLAAPQSRERILSTHPNVNNPCAIKLSTSARMPTRRLHPRDAQPTAGVTRCAAGRRASRALPTVPFSSPSVAPPCNSTGRAPPCRRGHQHPLRTPLPTKSTRPSPRSSPPEEDTRPSVLPRPRVSWPPTGAPRCPPCETPLIKWRAKDASLSCSAGRSSRCTRCRTYGDLFG